MTFSSFHESMDPSEMQSRALRKLTDVDAKPFSVIFEKSWQTGEDPADWKKGNIAPIFKKARKHNPGNYQRVSSPLCWRR